MDYLAALNMNQVAGGKILSRRKGAGTPVVSRRFSRQRKGLKTPENL
jgi:hypothetical protein